MKTILSLSIFLLSCLSAGCASHAKLVIESVPEGANVIDSITGEDYGVAPRTVYYDTTDVTPDSDRCFYLNGFETRWMSGATEQTELVKVCGNTTGAYKIAVSRPSSYPGIEQDMEWALQIQQEQAQAQARVARQARQAQIDYKYQLTHNPPLPFPAGNGTAPSSNN
tara:strand:+ start:133 stop:633 length:501 start_codon:yes stop_codon:yes gene_type:complete